MPLVVRLAPRERSARRDCRIRILYMYTLVSTGHPPRRDAPRAGINYPPISRSNCSVERRSSLSSIGRSRPEGGSATDSPGRVGRRRARHRASTANDEMWWGEKRRCGRENDECGGTTMWKPMDHERLSLRRDHVETGVTRVPARAVRCGESSPCPSAEGIRRTRLSGDTCTARGCFSRDSGSPRSVRLRPSRPRRERRTP